MNNSSITDFVSLSNYNLVSFYSLFHFNFLFLDHEGIDPRDLYDEGELGHCEVIPDIATIKASTK